MISPIRTLKPISLKASKTLDKIEVSPPIAEIANGKAKDARVIATISSINRTKKR